MSKTPEGIDIAVLPGGMWGAVWAIIAAEQGNRIRLHFRNQQDCDLFNRTHTFRRVPGVIFPQSIVATSNPKEALEGAKVVAIASRSQDYRQLIRSLRGLIRYDQVLVNLTKGLEVGTNLRMSQVFEEEYPGNQYRLAVWSGPNLAGRLANIEGETASAHLASASSAVNTYIEEFLGRGRVSLVQTPDVIGSELGGGLKNIMTMVCGLAKKLGMGDKMEYIISQCTEEMAGLGEALGADRETFKGPSGVGDLEASVEFESRNYEAGVLLATGQTANQLISSGVTYEGLHALKPALALADQVKVEARYIKTMHRIAYEGLAPREGLSKLIGA